MRIIILFISFALLSGCVSTHMKQFIGKDIREVVLVSGPPVNMLDMSEGVRAFQFKWGGGSFKLPTTTTTTGNIYSTGNGGTFTSNSITSGGGVVQSNGCIISYITEWDNKSQGWIVSDIRYPDQLVC